VKKWLIIGAAVVVVALIAVNLLKSSQKALGVEAGKVVRKDLVEVVTASGTLTPKRKVDVSASTIGKVTRLAVREGDRVEQGQLLLEIDPTEFRSVVDALQAAVRTARANLDLARAGRDKAKQDLERASSLFGSGLSSQEQIDAAEANARIEEARTASAEASLRQTEANLAKARYDLDKVTITSPMAGVVTRLNVEEGENAIMGTLNNAGTVLLTVADLATMEAEVDVDETEVVRVKLGQPVKVEVDAFPDTSFAGTVTEIGNSPIYTSTGQSQQAVDFKITVTLDDPIVGVRPGLTAKAEITVADAKQVLCVPIGAVTVREWPPLPKAGKGRRPRPTTAAADSVKREEVEGVFVIESGKAVFKTVEIGVTGEEDFEVLSGLADGQQIVTGPFRILRDLQHEEAVKVDTKKKGAGADKKRD
jgi:HlyD family secretion protein